MAVAKSSNAPLPLFSARLSVTAIVASGAAKEPTLKPAVKSGSAWIVSVSAALPRLIVSELVGLAKSVVSNVAPLSRDNPLPGVPSSESVAAFGPAGRLKITSLAVPVLVIGSRPVKNTVPKLLIWIDPSLTPV